MTSTTAKDPQIRISSSRRKSRPRSTTRTGARARRVLGRYSSADGSPREVLELPGRAGSRLVIDRDALTLADRRLVAHIAADEADGNGALVCELYLRDPSARWCRAVEPADLEAVFHEEANSVAADLGEAPDLTDARGRAHRIEPRLSDGALQLRWLRLERQREEIVSLREVIGALESYQPARQLTLAAICAHPPGSGPSAAVLRAELARMDSSPIVLNRGLREAVQRAIREQPTSMSAIALRCGRVKRDARGNCSGEASWLGRRIGLLPEAGADRPTPWVHSEVLGLIACSGLALSPREVEL